MTPGFLRWTIELVSLKTSSKNGQSKWGEGLGTMLLRFRTMHIGVALAGMLLSLLVATDAANSYFTTGLNGAHSGALRAMVSRYIARLGGTQSPLSKTTLMQRCC